MARHQRTTGALSQLLRFRVIDRQGLQARLVDFAADVAAAYPPITGIIYKQIGQPHLRLPWQAITTLDWRQRRLCVDDLTHGQASAPAADEVLLKRDVLDAMVLDLVNRRATRANDVWLEQRGSMLVVRGADISTAAVFNRLTRGLIAGGSKHQLYDWQNVEFLRGDARAAHAGAAYNRRIARLPAGDIARLTDALPYLHAAELLTLLPDQIAADTLEFLSNERQVQLFEELDEAQAIRVLTLMGPDEAADLLGSLGPEPTRELLSQLPEARAAQVLDLLRYPSNTVGGIMTNDVVTVSVALTAGEALEALRPQLKQPDFIHFIYVIEDDTRKLRGVLPLRELVTAPPNRPLTRLLNPFLVALNPLDRARVAAERVLDTGLVALPVIADDGRLLGAVTVGAAIAEMLPPSRRALAPKVFS